MQMKSLYSLMVVSGLLVAGFLFSLGAGAARGEAQEGEAKPGSPYELVVPLNSVMKVMDDVFYKMPERVKTGSSRAFKALQRESHFVAEMGNLYGRLKEHSKNEEWVAISGQMKSSALALAEAAAKKDGEKSSSLYEKVKESCGSCHDKFRD